MRVARLASVSLMGLFLLLLMIGAASGAGVITRVSTSSSAAQGNYSTYFNPSVSADGRYVAFQSLASNLVPGDTNQSSDIFVKDTQNGTTTRVSTDSAGNEANCPILGWYCHHEPVISSDGAHIVFFSYAGLAPVDTNGWQELVVKNLVTGAVALPATSSTGVQGNSSSSSPSISADGRYVAFRATATNLVAGDTNGQGDIFRKDFQTGALAMVSTSASGALSNGNSDRTAMSADGRYVAFVSGASNLVAGDTNGINDVFVKDMQTGAITLASSDSSGVQAASWTVCDDEGYCEVLGSNGEPSISADGRYVSFQSDTSNLVSGDTNTTNDIFVKDTQTGQTTRVSTDQSGGQANGGSSDPAISGTGRYVTFASSASNLVTADVNSRMDIFVKDTQTGQVARVSTDQAGVDGNNTSDSAAISADGAFVAFKSTASNLVTGDTNGVADMFMTAVAFEPACQQEQPALGLGIQSIYWASYADYTNGMVSVDFVLSNSGASGASNVAIIGAINTNGVTANAMPVAVGDIAAGGSASATVTYNAPTGVTAFRTSLYVTAEDACGTLYSYPGPMPGA